jgi:hypothetical protein
MCLSCTAGKYKLSDAANALINTLDPSMAASELNKQPPMVILAFDEAHVLVWEPAGNTWSKFSEFRRALRSIRSYPIFSVFLSTTGRVHAFIPSSREDLSARLMLRSLSLLPPFTELGFDQMVGKIRENEVNIGEVVKNEFMCRFGRPL